MITEEVTKKAEEWADLEHYANCGSERYNGFIAGYIEAMAETHKAKRALKKILELSIDVDVSQAFLIALECLTSLSREQLPDKIKFK